MNDCLLFNPCNEVEVTRIIESLPNKTSSGCDRLSNVLLKKLKLSVRLPIMILINQSLLKNKFPNELKIARVIALHKGGEKNEMDNYRPISLLSVISKVLEKIVHKRLTAFLKEKRVLTERQFGFREKHSTIHAIQQLVGEIINGFENEMNCVAVFLDIKKCFDSCNHRKILDKLEHYGVREGTLQWFESYLSDRYQYVESNGQTSCKIELQLGVPQGSILSPVLMSIMNNDLPSCLKSGSCVLFADDTTVYVIGRNLKFLLARAQKSLNLVAKWMFDNELALNIKKQRLCCLLQRVILTATH